MATSADPEVREERELQPSRNAKTDVAKWAGRLIPLTVGGLLALWFAASGIILSRDGTAVDLNIPVIAMTTVIPIVLGLVSWRRRLAAGGCLVLTAAALLAYSVAQGGHWAWDWTSYLVMFLVLSSLLAAGVINLVIWQHESGKTMMSLAAKAFHEEADTLCWAARLVSLTVGALLLLTALSVALLWAADILDYEQGASVLILLSCVPPLLAGIAWRRHLVGGILMLLLATALLTYSIATVHDWDSTAPFNVFTLLPPSVVLLAGGVLHLIVWSRQTRDESKPPGECGPPQDTM